MKIDDLVNLLCQFPGDTEVVFVPDFETGARVMWRTKNVIAILDDEKQPAFIGITSDEQPARRREASR